MNAMITSSQYADLNDFLSKHSSKNTDKPITHTRIGSKELNVYGGSYSIPKEELPVFYRYYYEHVFVKKRNEYLTEKQINGEGPLLVDFDFRYSIDVTKRLHTDEHIQDIIILYLEELKKLFLFEDGKQFPIYVMEKPNVNRLVDEQKTKDGIHMIIGIKIDNTMQVILRERILKQIGDILDLPLTNDWDSVLDEGISVGHTNWQLYGSKKPGNEAYRVTYYLMCEYNKDDDTWKTTPKTLDSIDLSKDMPLLSAQNDKHVKFEINPSVKEEYETRLSAKNNKTKKSGAKTKINLTLTPEEEGETSIQLSDITNFEILKKAVDNIMGSLKITEQYIREIHEYTQILPKQYYEPGSHDKNIQVAFALKHTDERLFLSWVMLRSKASDFDYSTIPSLYSDWKKIHNKQDGVTKRSIMYWAKQDAFADYERVKRGTIDHYIEETIFEAGDWDYAMVLYHMFKDKYVCSSTINKTWYVFNKHRWEKDEGQRLRMAISKNLFELYSDKQTQYLADSHLYEPTSEEHEKIQRKIKKIAEICIKFKKTNDKNNIVREAMEIFYDKDFTKNMDANPYLMCFSNGVFDFKNKEFRQGYPQDYITKSTGIPFVINYRYDDYKEVTDQINHFMEQLFPQKDLCRYMWDHLASSLIGIKKEHVFNIYRGSGSNGKSILTDLMSQALGEYKGTVPITLVTEKRGSIGGTSSEVIQLKGVRYAVMQEPSKEATINEGIMKELTGGDPIQARALYSDSEIFIPQFSLVVCTNALFEIKSNDDGTWRRMKLVDFLAKFISGDESHTDDTPYVYQKDKTLKEKLPSWAPVFMAMLVKRACETNGEVVDCPEVVTASNKYRESQDCITGFMTDKLVKAPGFSIGKKILHDVFKEWFQMNLGSRKPPKLSEIEEVMNKKFGKRNSKTNKWEGVKFKDDDEANAGDDLDETNLIH